jgi:transaldolase
MSNQLQALRELTTVVADTGDIEAIKKYQPVDATTNPSLLLKAAEMPQYKSHLEAAVAWAKEQSSDPEQQIIDAGDKLSVTIGTDIVNIVPGRISTEVDARLSFDTAASIEKAHKLVKLYDGCKQRPHID